MKKNIALLAGGYSGEHVISLKTAQTIETHLDSNLYAVYKIVVSRKDWIYKSDSGEEISVDKNDFSLTISGEKVLFDAAFIAIHGTPGEDGRMQGYLDMIGVPYSTCSAIVSAITFNKISCNRIVRDLNIVDVAKSVHLIKGRQYSLGAILDKLSLPLFVKPNESGSSLGVSKVKEVSELLPAIERAFSEDNEVLIEEFIEGRELTIGVYRREGRIITLPPTEIISKNEFFDYEAKYTQGASNEITPAQITEPVQQQLDANAAALYNELNCRGIVRIDFILRNSNKQLYFLEVNTMPGQSEASIVPQQVLAAGKDLSTFYGDLLNRNLCQRHPGPTKSNALMSDFYQKRPAQSPGF